MLELARAMLGQLLVRRAPRSDRDGEESLVGRIVEVEAYAGKLDPASHSFRGPTPRCATMFGAAGRLYVYFTYGAHFCANVVGGSRRDAAAVLLRAVEPVEGVAAMRRGRLARTKAGVTADAIARGELDPWLARGPGNLTAAFGLDRKNDGCDLLAADELFIARGTPAKRVAWTPRIGLGENRAAPWLWRCFDLESASVTRVPSRWPRSALARPTLAQVRRRRNRGGTVTARDASAPHVHRGPRTRLADPKDWDDRCRLADPRAAPSHPCVRAGPLAQVQGTRARPVRR